MGAWVQALKGLDQAERGLGQPLGGLGQPLRSLGGDGRTDGRTDVRTDRFPLYSTGLRPLRFPPGPLPKKGLRGLRGNCVGASVCSSIPMDVWSLLRLFQAYQSLSQATQRLVWHL